MTDKEEEDNVIATTLRKISFFWPCMVFFWEKVYNIYSSSYFFTSKGWVYFFFCIIAYEANQLFFNKSNYFKMGGKKNLGTSPIL